MPRSSKSTTNIYQYTGKSFPSRIEIDMSLAKINSRVDNALDKTATEAGDRESEQIIASLWDRTFVSYPSEMIVKLPYYFQSNSSVAGNLGTTATTNQFKVNSMYDFDLTGGGHQPLGRDTWAGIFDYYKVLETRLHVTMRSSAYATGAQAQTVAGTLTDGNFGPQYLAPTWVGGMLDITANPPTTLTQWQEAARVTGNSQQRFTKPTKLERIGSRPNTTVEYSMVWKPEMFDTAVIFQATENTWTPVGSDPANLNYFSDIIFNGNSSANTVYYTMEVEATMLVAFKNVNRTLLNTTN